MTVAVSSRAGGDVLCLQLLSLLAKNELQCQSKHIRPLEEGLSIGTSNDRCDTLDMSVRASSGP